MCMCVYVHFCICAYVCVMGSFQNKSLEVIGQFVGFAFFFHQVSLKLLVVGLDGMPLYLSSYFRHPPARFLTSLLLLTQ